MAVPLSYPAVWDDQEFYPLHEEDDVPEIPPHHRWVTYLYDALEARFPAWFVTSNVCIYWEPGNTAVYRAPDLLVVKEPLSEAVDRVYQTWKQPPVAFVAEIGSRSTLRIDEGPKVEIYQDQVRAGEYYYANPPHGDQRLWRRRPDGYEAVVPEANGRLRSAELGLELALEDGGVRLYTLEGELLLNHVETDAAWQDAEAARQDAERRRETSEAQRAEADARAAAAGSGAVAARGSTAAAASGAAAARGSTAAGDGGSARGGIGAPARRAADTPGGRLRGRSGIRVERLAGGDGRLQPR
jgi:Uma2 family endonuclease